MYKSEDKEQKDIWIQWLLDFRKENLTGLSEDEIKGVTARMVGFSDVLPRKELPLRPVRTVEAGDYGGPKLPVLSAEKIQAMQKTLCDGFDALMYEGNPGALRNVWKINDIQYEGLTLMRNRGNRGLFIMPTIKFTSAFWLSVATLLVEAGPRLQRCPECQTIFLAKTNRKSCCSSQCSQRGRNRRFIEKKSPEEKYEMRRAKYIRKVEQTLGNVKPEQRGPRKKKGDS